LRSSPASSTDSTNLATNLALTLDGARLFVENFGAQSVRVIDTESGLALATIPLPDPPEGMALSADGAELYVATGNWSVTFGPGPLFSRTSTGQFSVFSALTFALRDQVDTGVTPAMLAYHALSRRAAVPSTFIDGYDLVDLPPRRGPRRR